MKSCIKERRGRVGILKGKINQNFWNQTKNTKIIIKIWRNDAIWCYSRNVPTKECLPWQHNDSHRFQASSREYSYISYFCFAWFLYELQMSYKSKVESLFSSLILQLGNTWRFRTAIRRQSNRVLDYNLMFKATSLSENFEHKTALLL